MEAPFDEEQLSEPDIDYAYDTMRDDFLLCDSEETAIWLIKHYGKSLAKQYLPEVYQDLLDE